MKDLLQQLLQRWEQAFDEIDQLTYHKSQVTTIQYAEGFRYNLSSYSPDSFPSQGAMLEKPGDSDQDNLYEYGINDKGRPCFVTFKHVFNGISWEGYYTYSDALAEYVEYCLNTGIPSVIDRLNFLDGKKVSYQSLHINTRGSMFSSNPRSKKEIIDFIKNDDHSLIYTITSYLYGHDNRIEKTTSLHNMPGIGQYTTYDEYAYDEHHNLDTIRTFFKNGDNRLSYCRVPENITTTALIETVAQAMAQSISETLLKAEIRQPIHILELNYRFADSYIPLLVYKSAPSVNEQVVSYFDFTNEYYNGVQVDILPFEREFAQLEQLMNEIGDMGLGRTMLRKTAYLLTTSKIFGKTKTTGDFAAYAVDLSLEGHSHEEFEEILIECGLTPTDIEYWKEKGILPRYNS
jgi:hypothetical protein